MNPDQRQDYNKAVTAPDELPADPDTQKILEGDGIRAGYKIQVNFGPNRSSLKEFAALITLWGSGKFLHGGGDDGMYFCFSCEELEKAGAPKSAWKQLIHILKTKGEGSSVGCGSPIPSGGIGAGLAFCPSCRRQIVQERLTGQFPFWGTTHELAEVTAYVFDSLKSNADIYCKYAREDIRYLVMEKKLGSEEARRLRGLFIYPLAHIIKDTSAGASLVSRFTAFFNA